MCVGMYYSKNDGRAVFPFFSAFCLFATYCIFKMQPIAVAVQRDSFTVRFLWKRRSYPFSKVNYIMRDEVSFPKSGIIQTVNVGFSSGHSLQLLFPGVRDKLYEDLVASWHAAQP